MDNFWWLVLAFCAGGFVYRIFHASGLYKLRLLIKEGEEYIEFNKKLKKAFEEELEKIKLDYEREVPNDRNT